MKEKIMLGIICLETVIIFFIVFSVYIHINRFKSHHPINIPRFSSNTVYKELNLTESQKKEYDTILADFMKIQKESSLKQYDNFKKLHDATSNPNATEKEIDILKKEQAEIISYKISSSVDYIKKVRKILTKDQLEIFCSILDRKEMYKIMPPPNNFGHNKKYKKRKFN